MIVPTQAQAQAQHQRARALKRFEGEKTFREQQQVHRTRALEHQRVADAAQRQAAFRKQQLAGKPPRSDPMTGVLALRPDRSMLLPRHVPGSAHDVTMRETAALKQIKLRIPEPKRGGFGRFSALPTRGPLPHDVTAGSRVLPVQTTTGTEVHDILTGLGAMRLRAKQRAPSLTVPTHGSTQMLSMFEEAKTEPLSLSQKHPHCRRRPPQSKRTHHHKQRHHYLKS